MRLNRVWLCTAALTFALFTGCGSALAASIAPTAAQIDAYLIAKGSPMAGTGAWYVSQGKLYGVNPAFIVSISGAESTFGKNCFAKYNAWGYFWNGNSPASAFASWNAGITKVTWAIGGYSPSHLYQGDGLYTVATIATQYLPVSGGRAAWITNVTRFMNEQKADPNDTRYYGYAAGSVFRFFNKKNGSHFYTVSEVEMNDTIKNLSGTYNFEGVAYVVKPANADPLYRFFKKSSGTHFYTAGLAERDNVIKNLSKTYSYEGVAYNVSVPNLPGSTPVYRFYKKSNGSHFYTAGDTEKDSVIKNLSATYKFEGVAFYLAP